MAALIVVTPEHKLPAPLTYNLGNTTLIITSDYQTPDAFELAKPAQTLEDALSSPTNILDPDETYNLYQCLHSLFVGPRCDEESEG